MEKEKKTVIMRDVVFLDEDLWRKVKMEEFDKDKRSTDPLNITSYPICSIEKNGKLKEIDLLSYKKQNNLCFNVTDVPDEIKMQLAEKYAVRICEIPIQPVQKARTMTLLPPTAECFSDQRLTKEDKKQLGSEYVLVENRENGYKITKCILFNGYGEQIADQVFLSVNLSNISPELMDKIINDIVTFIPNEHGYYNFVSQDEDIKEVDKTM